MGSLIIVGDRVLIEVEEGEKKTSSGLVLPASVAEREEVRSGTVVRVGPGYVMPNPDFSDDETWSGHKTPVRYLPLQAEPGDVAYFLQKNAIDIEYLGKPYVIVQHSSILALVRPESEDTLGDIDELLKGK